MLKLERIINDENPMVYYRIRKSSIRSLMLDENELKTLKKLIDRELEPSEY